MSTPVFDQPVAALLARLSAAAYEPPGHFAAYARPYVLGDVKFHDRWDAQAYSCTFVKPVSGIEARAVVFRGTQVKTGWSWADVLANITARLVSDDTGDGVMVHEGYRAQLAALWPEVSERLQGWPSSRVYFAGHSMGGAVASLAALRFFPRALYTFGQPRAGNAMFAAVVSGAVEWWRVVNVRDLAVMYPLLTSGYRHGGTLVRLTRGGRVVVPDRWGPCDEVPLPLRRRLLYHRVEDYASKLAGVQL